MKRPKIMARATALGAAVLCGGLAIAFAGIRANSGIESRVLIEDGAKVVQGGGPAAGGNLVEGRA